MLQSVLRKFFGSANDRFLKKYQKTVESINALEPEMEKLSDDALKAYTSKFKKRLSDGESLDKILPEAFAVVREASKRVLGMRPFDVQLIGGMILHHGMITEMKTGEGKTLVATLPVYLNALTGKGVHVVTVNDYLAKRDAEWMGQIYRFLDLTIGCIVHGMTDQERRAAYGSDITYGTNHEFGFDFLRDNMKFRLADMVQRGFNFGIVDEVDSILIDEARTPLIISGPTEDSSELYAKIDKLIRKLDAEDFEIDEKSRSVTLTELGVERIESLLREQNMIVGNGLYDVQNIAIVHHVNQALKAHKNFSRDVDYLVKDNKIVIVDEFTGRMMEGRRYSEGLHQALEAKEGVEIQMENQTLASITYQNFFRQYKKLSGMTGTAMTEADEFEEIYNLRVVVVPTNVPVKRQDHDDEVYLSADEKYMAMAELIKQCRERKQPVLVGTTSIEKSEYMSTLLKRLGIEHQVLNARYHEQEAYIIADAGRLGAVTIATNMAGRGTDIKLGGNLEMRVEKELADMAQGPDYDKRVDAIRREIEADKQKVLEAGGLYVIGTERHESRRVDNQLRGRSGRQGDPGASKFFISLQDDLMRIFGSERLDSMLRNLGVQKGEAIVHKWITRSIERAQQKVEARNFDIRKHLLRYDDVMNEQRKIIYSLRRDVMGSEEIKETLEDMRVDMVNRVVRRHIVPNSLIELWGLDDLHADVLRLLGMNLPIKEWANEEGIAEKELEERIYKELEHKMAAKEKLYGDGMLRTAEKTLFLRVLDSTWKDHLQTLDHLRQGINLRAYAQGNPLNEYKREAFNLFESMLDRLREEIVSQMAHFEISADDVSILERMLDINMEGFEEQEPGWLEDNGIVDDKSLVTNPELVMDIQPIKRRAQAAEVDPNDPDTWGRVQRNSPCPCGSGEKYKHCHGKI